MKALPQAIEDLIDNLSRFPGIGEKSAARIALFLLKMPDDYSDSLISSISEARNINTCKICFNFTDKGKNQCSICKSSKRDRSKIMVVEDALDLLAIEQTGVFDGIYHVLGGVISPMNGIGPEEIRIKELFDRLHSLKSKIELIIATNPNMEGEATALYIKNEIKKNKSLSKKIKISGLARGLSNGSDIDYIDSSTLKRALEDRINF